MKYYDHCKIERKWRKRWEQDKLYETPKNVSRDEKMYVLPQLPYPSGSGLHVGHAEGYTACDIYARYMRMQGKKVLQVFGWDAFGLPAENFAIKTGIHPRVNTDKAIDNFREQIKSLGISADWDREVGSHNPDYYKWTQWFFLLMLERGLAYRKEQAVNWDPVDKTVLANEQVLPDGTGERSGAKVEQRMMSQWFLKITDYADRLREDLDKVDWPSETIKRQRDWIGRSEGARLKFEVSGAKDMKLDVFTTRPDTVFGATFTVIAPEHELITLAKGKVKNWKDVKRYVDEAGGKTELQRQQQKVKSGIRLEGVEATNPATNEDIPIYVADYVLSGYGTGAIMAVPGHDDRDFEFAVSHDLPIVRVVKPSKESKSIILKQSVTEAFVKQLEDEGFRVTLSPEKHYQVEFSEDMSEKYIELIRANISDNFFVDVIGAVNLVIFKDIVISTDTPEGEAKAVKEITERYPRLARARNLSALLTFQYGQDDAPNYFYHDLLIYTGQGVLMNSGQFSGDTTEQGFDAIVNWLSASDLADKEINFKLRDWSISRQRYWGAPIPIVYDPEGNPHPVDVEDLPIKLPEDVDFKPTGVPPLAKSKEFQKGVEEKYGKGWKREVETLDTFMCSSWYYFRYIDPNNDKAFASKEALDTWMPVDFYIGGPEHVNGHLLYSRFFTKVLFDAGIIDFDEPFLVHRHQGTILGEDNRKMSKRWGNVINPTDVVNKYGADTARMYEMFMGPLEQAKAWDDSAVRGVRKFLQRVYDFSKKFKQGKKNRGDIRPLLHKLNKKVGDYIPKLRYNVAIAAFMKTMNSFEDEPERVNLAEWEVFIKLLAPFAPFICEELWKDLGNKRSIHLEAWPEYDAKRVVDETVTVAVQVNGRLRDTLDLETGLKQSEAENAALSSPKVQKYLEGSKPEKVVYVQDKIINFVI
ncbi:MAG: leucine--tRNA ligase [Candidatus Dojkabacteria bacterium]